MSIELAINLWDLDRTPVEVKKQLLSGALDLSSAIRVGAGEEDSAVMFICGLRKAALICDMLRSYDRSVNDPLARVYINRTYPLGEWVSVPSTVPLTIVHTLDNRKDLLLNPRVFPTEHRLIPPRYAAKPAARPAGDEPAARPNDAARPVGGEA